MFTPGLLRWFSAAPAVAARGSVSEMSCDAEFHMGTLFCGAFVLDRPSVSSVISGGIMHFKFKRCNKFDSVILLFYIGRLRNASRRGP